MLKLTKLTIATTTLLLAISPAAFAQDDARNIAPDIQIVDSFISADIDADGALDRDEFVSFVVMKSDEGDADYKSIKFLANMIITLTQRIIMLMDSSPLKS